MVMPPSSSPPPPPSTPTATHTTTVPFKRPSIASFPRVAVLAFFLLVFLAWTLTAHPLISTLASSNLSPSPSDSARNALPPLQLPLPPRRRGRTLVYWKPHKTGSTSMRSWLKRLSSPINLNVTLFKTSYYPYSRVQSHARLLSTLTKSKPATCSIIAGHIRIPPSSSTPSSSSSSSSTPRAQALGTVITTIRTPFSVLASKYFHRTANTSMDTFDIDHWSTYWYHTSPCEPLNYYDANYVGCNLTADGVYHRVQTISNGIDCVVDTSDGTALDLHALCHVMQVAKDKCPEFPRRRAKFYDDFYEQIQKNHHVRNVVAMHLFVVTVLNDVLRTKLCRFLPFGDRDSGSPDHKGKEVDRVPSDGDDNGDESSAVDFMQRKPKWPFRNCHLAE